jgi:hypothetical protein
MNDMHEIQRPPTHSAGMRKHRRFELQFPVFLSFPAGGIARELEGISKNVSLGGVLVKTGDQVPLRTKITMTMNVIDPLSRRPVRLHGAGEVVRIEALEQGAGFAIAVKCERPISEIRMHLPQNGAEL